MTVEKIPGLRSRVASIDLVRGIIMVLMALDHTRDFFHTDALLYNPTDLTRTHAALFFTRWITHFCMPGFVLLAGTGVSLMLRNRERSQAAKFLLTRGLWMIVLEIVVMRFGYFFNFYFDMTILSPLWCFGVCFIILAGLVYLRERILLWVGIAITLVHDLVNMIPVAPTDPSSPWWTALMRFGLVTISPGHAVISPYPVIPWLGIMLLGYCLGSLYDPTVSRELRVRLLLRLGAVMVAAFVLLRLLNLYGDPAPWSIQRNILLTELSFLNTTKYPVSLLFTLMTLGPLSLALAAFEYVNPDTVKPLVIFGRVPLFYFVVHFYLIHSSALLLFLHKTGKSLSEIDLHFSKSFGGVTAEGGYTLPWVYVAWMSIVLLMYPLCRWYNTYKNTHQNRWLRYL